METRRELLKAQLLQTVDDYCAMGEGFVLNDLISASFKYARDLKVPVEMARDVAHEAWEEIWVTA